MQGLRSCPLPEGPLTFDRPCSAQGPAACLREKWGPDGLALKAKGLTSWTAPFVSYLILLSPQEHTGQQWPL